MTLDQVIERAEQIVQEQMSSPRRHGDPEISNREKAL
jgi:hypothetical protein